MGALLELKQEGKIRAIGVCNATSADMEQYRQVGPLDSDQEKYSMLARAIEADQLPYCRAHGIAMLAYSPLALGLLTGKIGPDRQFGVGDLRRANPHFAAENRRRVAQLLDRFRPLAEAHRITATQLVIAWTFHQPGMTHVLCGARTPAQATENAAAGEVRLSDDDLRAMQAAIDEYTAQAATT